MATLRFGLAGLLGVFGLAQLVLGFSSDYTSDIGGVLYRHGIERVGDWIGEDWALLAAAGVTLVVAALVAWRPRLGAIVAIGMTGFGTLLWARTYDHYGSLAGWIAQGSPAPFALLAAVALLLALQPRDTWTP